MKKTILLASFIFPERLQWFLSYLETKFAITKDKVFCYKNLDDESKVIVTFKLLVVEGKRLNLKDLFPNAVVIHKKGEAFYTINALNKLIEETSDVDLGNTDYKSIKIDWEKYQNKFVLINDDKLAIFNVERIF
jgi:hypothetical protein